MAKRLPRKGVGPLPALLLDRGQLPLLQQPPAFPCAGARRREWFGAVTITLEDDGGDTLLTDTLLTGPVADQAALHGLLKNVRDLGMPLISAIRAKPP